MEEINDEPAGVLLVEDDEAHTTLIIRSLREAKVINQIYNVIDGEEALNYLFHRGKYVNIAMSPRPDLILLDLRLPKVDGLDVLKEIKESEELKDIPVVILTTSENEIDMVKSYEYHANSYLVKPVDFNKFNEMIRDVAFYWLSWNQCSWMNTPLLTLEKRR
jgi:CheY-like chemotaxis protein